MPMAVASLTAIGGISQGMNRGSRIYWPKAREMTAIAAGLEDTDIHIHTHTHTHTHTKVDPQTYEY